MNLNSEDRFKFIILPVIGILVIVGYIINRNIINKDGFYNFSGELYKDMMVGYGLESNDFAENCLNFEQENFEIKYGETRQPSQFLAQFDDRTSHRVTLVGYGSLINKCRHDVVVKGISLKNKFNTEKYWSGTFMGSDYPNVPDEEVDEASNNIYFPNGNQLKANGKLKIKVESSDWFISKWKDGDFMKRERPNKDTKVIFKLLPDGWGNDISITEENSKLKLAQDGLVYFDLIVDNPHGKRTMTYWKDRCSLRRHPKGKQYLATKQFTKGACTQKNWIIKNKKTNKVILNALDFANDLYPE